MLTNPRFKTTNIETGTIFSHHLDYTTHQLKILAKPLPHHLRLSFAHYSIWLSATRVLESRGIKL